MGEEVLLFSVSDVHEATDQSALGGTYVYRVAAVNAVGVGMKSQPVEITVEAVATVPGLPRNLDTDAGNGTVNLTWDEPIDDGGSPITGYIIYRGTSESNIVLLLERGNATHFLDDSVMNGVTYYYKVSAVNGAGEGNLTGSVHATPTVEGGIDDDDDEGGENTMLYIIIAIVAVAAVAGVAFFILRKRK
ncbi:MAG TPA: fibronectin type III domain-containing protein [Methanomassiliicoccales archaeon]|nr:fibronectin type III domain-containing protein [Methanomassiliicoccales archaeon]